MKHYRIAPKEYISERFIQDFYGYSKKECLNIYLGRFPQFTKTEIEFI